MTKLRSAREILGERFRKREHPLTADLIVAGHGQYDAIAAIETAQREALEAAAAAVGKFPEKVLYTWDRPGGPPGNGHRPTTRKDLSRAIRALGDET